MERQSTSRTGLRLAVASFSQETDTFNPEPTTLADFVAFGIYEGDTVLKQLTGLWTVGGFLEATRSRSDIEVVPIVRGYATSGGRITGEAHRYFKDSIVEGLRSAGPLDGVALLLHGACSSELDDDVEGSIIEACRALLGPAVPIVVTLDHHANITKRMVDACDAIVGYRTQPHDWFEAAHASTEVLLDIIGGARPTMAWRKIPMLSHGEHFRTSESPMKTWFDMARSMESRPGVLTASTFPMQPWLDVKEAGWTALVVTDNDEVGAQQMADDLAALAWSLRAEFMEKDSISAVEAVRLAQVATSGLVVIADGGDRVFGGAAGDSTELLAAMLQVEGGLSALVPLVDRGAVKSLEKAGEGATVTLALGAGMTPSFEPVSVTGFVRKVATGIVDLGDAAHHGSEVDMGTTVILDVGPVTLMISETRGLGGNLPEIYRWFGVEPEEYKAVVVKTGGNFQYFASITSEVIRADTSGPTQSDIESLPWGRIPRPMYPMDDLQEPWQGFSER